MPQSLLRITIFNCNRDDLLVLVTNVNNSTVSITNFTCCSTGLLTAKSTVNKIILTVHIILHKHIKILNVNFTIQILKF